MKRLARIASGAGIVLALGFAAASITGAQGVGSIVGQSVTVVGNGNTVISTTASSTGSVTVSGAASSPVMPAQMAAQAAAAAAASAATTSVTTGGTGSSAVIVIPGMIVTPIAQAPTSYGAAYGGTCPVVTNLLKVGAANSSADVMRLQTFLKNVEGANISMTGVYDQATVNAVIAFQTKYKSEILGPWSASIPSGMVYITTAKKINQIACGAQLVISQGELSEIQNFVAKRDGGMTTGANTGATAAGGSITIAGTADSQQAGVIGSQTSLTGSASGTSSVDNRSDEDSDEEYNIEYAAAAGSSSMAERFWAYIRGWFR